MGYNTRLELRFADVIAHPERRVFEQDEYIVDAFITEYPDYDDAFTYLGDESEDGKWYDAEKDVREFSRIYPNHVIRLVERGEDGRMWVGYYFQGKVDKREIVPSIPPPDWGKLGLA